MYIFLHFQTRADAIIFICSLFSENISELWFKIFTIMFKFTDPSMTQTIKYVDFTTVKTT